jgi:hypothetical protein
VLEQADARYEADDEDGDDGCHRPEPARKAIHGDGIQIEGDAPYDNKVNLSSDNTASTLLGDKVSCVDEESSCEGVQDWRKVPPDKEMGPSAEGPGRGGETSALTEETDTETSIESTAEENEMDWEETNGDTFVNSTCRDEESDCSIESDAEDNEMDADASIESIARDNMEGHLKVPKDDDNCQTQMFNRSHAHKVYVERWDGVAAWQTVYRRMYTFVDSTQKVEVETYNKRRHPIDNQERQWMNRFIEEIQKDPEKVMWENDEIRQPRAKQTSRFVDTEEGESRSVELTHGVSNETGGGANGRHVWFSSQITKLESYACLKTRGRPFCEPDRIRDKNHPEPTDVLHCHGFEGPGQCGEESLRYNCSNSNIGTTKKPTNLSVLPEDQGKMYPPGDAPKAPDKGFRRVQEGHRTEVYTPQSGNGATLVNQSRLGRKVHVNSHHVMGCVTWLHRQYWQNGMRLWHIIKEAVCRPVCEWFRWWLRARDWGQARWGVIRSMEWA